MADLFDDAPESDMEQARRPGKLDSAPVRDFALDRERCELIMKDALRPKKPQDDIGAGPLFGGPRQKGLF